MSDCQPSFSQLYEYIVADEESTTFPIYKFLSAHYLTPHTAYLKLTGQQSVKTESFLFESATNGEEVSRYSFMGVSPRRLIKTGPTENNEVDPLILLENELADVKQAQLPGIPNLSGGAIGYISYDCIKYFEPTTRNDDLKDVLKVPEAILMMFDLIVAYDNVFQRFQIINNVHVDRKIDDEKSLKEKYEKALEEIEKVYAILESPTVKYPEQPKIEKSEPFTSNIGQEGYEGFVHKLKEHIKKGDVIQAVPSQRISRPTKLHPFNIYNHLRTVNPSPYMFYIDYLDFQVVGASPELLVKSDSNNKVITHPIAGTIRRGKTLDEDNKLANELKSSLKDRAEHVMLVDLARNDINRVCDPVTTNVDSLLEVQRFSHVMHLVSQVSGTLRDDKSRFDAFRSIFPAGTVSGAPKVRAMQLISELEKEKRGVYAGAVGHWSYDGKSMNTCIALRTMVVKDGVAYLQAGGGIVYDSDPYDEYIETINKMKANNNTIVEAEKLYM
ncbi:hypothetical protein CANINC_000250 [Pichia inconspicua]|uniref:anthranilate synthase n=1 Tax=Pichia inconspicua TaxID=52247 RepID=A0A4T0X857_9ASCO|nr:hypothetical protein CANINC_000250 [[Candida] inconspicua]